jgi:hypothetical protein
MHLFLSPTWKYTVVLVHINVKMSKVFNHQQTCCDTMGSNCAVYKWAAFFSQIHTCNCLADEFAQVPSTPPVFLKYFLLVNKMISAHPIMAVTKLFTGNGLRSVWNLGLLALFAEV